MSAFKVLLFYFFVKIAMVSAFPSSSEFVAAVYEHVSITAAKPDVVLTRKEAVAIVMRNLDVYEVQINKAKQQNASIIVFPEYGLTGLEVSRETFRPYLEDIPDPTKTTWNPCTTPQANESTPILYRLSCLAKKYAIYIVVNMGDIKLCNKTTDPRCPADGRYQYNTNVAFDDKGKLIARYHKQHLFKHEYKYVNRPHTPEFITFDSPFGKFGTFTCYDVLFHDPAVALVTKHGIDHVVFSTAWFDTFPLYTAIGFHGSWARGMEVNFISANAHTPPYTMTGSGIFTPLGVKKYYRSMSENGSLVVATLPKHPGKIPRNISSGDSDKIQATNKDSFYSKLLNLDPLLFKELKQAEGSVSVCYNGSQTCCSLEYKMKTKRDDEIYALGVYDGYHVLFHYRACVLIKCLGLDRHSCGKPTLNASTIFESFTMKSQLNTSYIFPQVVADGVSLVPEDWEHNMPVSQLKTKRSMSRGILMAAIYGRVYELDDRTPVPTSETRTPVPSPGTRVTCLFSLVSLICLLVILVGGLI